MNGCEVCGSDLARLIRRPEMLDNLGGDCDINERLPERVVLKRVEMRQRAR
jgi:hypothetical protein